jgi:hypothetical protein
MSDLSAIEKRKLERVLQMGGGYVLNFSNRTFAEFFSDELGIDIYSDKYDYGSGSKANRMRAFWDLESNYVVGKALELLSDDWSEYAGPRVEPPSEAYFKIARRLKESAPVPDMAALVPITDDKSFESLARSVKEAIDKDRPEHGLDRLHTFVVKYFRALCEKRRIAVDRKKPLHSLVGEYIKAVREAGLIESEMTERILKSSIAIMEAFNKVRNDQSFAHDNEILNYNESLLIFGHVTSSIRFIHAIERQSKGSRCDGYDEIPF